MKSQDILDNNNYAYHQRSISTASDYASRLKHPIYRGLSEGTNACKASGNRDYHRYP
ncbi:hypothetical protein [Coleofasciculus sp. FACHB-501]|uniref:hypothetical protein n=1 Tax=Cyanophyceae TaxID=3028117 RepID=UPI00168219C2|nr:hypothetical protein [Coleofasciculus sp. FACHB-501]MBD1837218.1 hypothetical protein [Coleofasciculus sp. FACHB-501]